MFYAASKTDWLRPRLARAELYRGIRAGLLTLGHLRTLECAECRLVCGADGKAPTAEDYGLIVAASTIGWRRFRRLWERASRSLARKVRKCTPRNVEEKTRVLAWWMGQFSIPGRVGETQAQIDARERAHVLAENTAATPAERYAVRVCSIRGWATITECASVWDVRLLQVRHLMLADAENSGAHHIPRDLLEDY